MTEWSDLCVRMQDRDGNVRSEAAIAAADLWRSDYETMVTTDEILKEIARLDAANPGVADAFLATAMYSLISEDEITRPWLLKVLEARHENPADLSPVPGNDLEFYAHEWFDDDFDALSKLLDWGYRDSVEWALDHGELPRAQDVILIERLCDEYGRGALAVPLAQRYGILRPEFLAKCTETEIDDVPAALYSEKRGKRSEITTLWFFFRSDPLLVPRAREDGAAILGRLRANAWLPGEVEAKLDRACLESIGFPETPGTTRRSFFPRQDVALDIAVRSGTNEIVALRLVRARTGSAEVRACV